MAVRIGTLRGSRFSLAGPKRRRPNRDVWRYHSPLPFIHFDRLSDFQSFTLTAPINPLPDVIDLYLWKWILKNTAHSGHHRFPRDHFYPAIFHLTFERLLGQLDGAPAPSKILERLTRRRETIIALWELIRTKQVVHIRGTPATGKSTLARLLQHHVSTNTNNFQVSYVAWPVIYDHLEPYTTIFNRLSHTDWLYLNVVCQTRRIESRLTLELFELLGNLYIIPKSTGNKRAGRADFAIPSQEWIVECVRESSKLHGHFEGFLGSGKYTPWLKTEQVQEFIMLDFRVPTKTHQEAERNQSQNTNKIMETCSPIPTSFIIELASWHSQQGYLSFT